MKEKKERAIYIFLLCGVGGFFWARANMTYSLYEWNVLDRALIYHDGGCFCVYMYAYKVIP